ncbi:hypothetical protein Tsubulata_025705, partial [Turnera subulata]
MVVPVLSSSTIIDSTGAPCTKSTTILDLARIEGLLQSNSARPSLNQARMSLTPSSRTKLLHLLLWVRIWVNLNQVTETKSLIQPLDFIPNIIAPGSSLIKIPNDVLELGRKKYKLCLVGQFMESSLSRALYGGPWHVGGVPLHLRLWDSKFIGISCSMVVPVLSSSTIIDSTEQFCSSFTQSGKNVTDSDLTHQAPPPATLGDDLGEPKSGMISHSTSSADAVKQEPVVSSKSTWASKVTETKSLIQPLDFIPTIIAPGSCLINIPNDVLELGRKKYKLCLVGQLMGKAPRLGLIHAIFNKLWGREGSIITVPYKEDLFLIQFPTESSLSRALYGGPWHVGGVPLHLRLWDSK